MNGILHNNTLCSLLLSYLPVCLHARLTLLMRCRAVKLPVAWPKFYRLARSIVRSWMRRNLLLTVVFVTTVDMLTGDRG